MSKFWIVVAFLLTVIFVNIAVLGLSGIENHDAKLIVNLILCIATGVVFGKLLAE